MMVNSLKRSGGNIAQVYIQICWSSRLASWSSIKDRKWSVTAVDAPSQTEFPEEEGAAVPLRMTCQSHEPSLASLLGKVGEEGFNIFICARHAQPVFATKVTCMRFA